MKPAANAQLLSSIMDLDIGQPLNYLDVLGWLAEAGLVLVNDHEAAQLAYLEALAQIAPAVKEKKDDTQG
jgi:hypothetical protein